MSAGERKKLESKKRKAEAKAKAEADEAKVKAAVAAKAEKGAKGNKGKPDKPVDEDPEGAALASVEDPLEKASVFLRTLQLHAPKNLRTHTLACALALRKKRYLLALRALRRAVALAPDDPDVHTATIEFLLEMDKEAASLPPTIARVLEANRAAIGAPPTQSLEELNKAFLLKAEGAPAAVLAAAALQLQIAPAQKDAAKALVTALDPSKLSLALAVRAHTLLATSFGAAAAAEAFGAKARARYPLAEYFQPPEVLPQGIQDGKGASE